MRTRPVEESTRAATLATLVVTLVAGSGCTNRPSFSERSSSATVEQARTFAAPHKGPIEIAWSPATFPDRVDEIGPVGQEGSATRAMIPTGPMLSARTHELLDAAVGVSTSSDAVLTIDVRDATSEYRYALGFVTERHIDAARSTLEAEFRYGDHRWEERLVAHAAEEGSGLTGTALLDKVWDDIALGIAESVVAHLPDHPVAAMIPAAAPAAPEGAFTITEEVEALKRILIRKRLITEAEWKEILAEVAAEREEP